VALNQIEMYCISGGWPCAVPCIYACQKTLPRFAAVRQRYSSTMCACQSQRFPAHFLTTIVQVHASICHGCPSRRLGHDSVVSDLRQTGSQPFEFLYSIGNFSSGLQTPRSLNGDEERRDTIGLYIWLPLCRTFNTR